MGSPFTAFMRKKILLVVMLIVWGGAAVLGYTLYKTLKYAKEEVPPAKNLAAFWAQEDANATVLQPGTASQQTSQQSSQESSSPQVSTQMSGSQQTASTQATTPLSQKLPKELNFDMPFYSQAPFGNWDYPWQEACEEASILLIANVYQQKNWTAEQFNNEILKLVEWEKKRFGSYEHTDVQQTAAMLKEYFGLKSIIHDNPTFEDVQEVLNKGHLVVMTFAGKKLHNPNYTNGGPNYHAMVIKGYKQGNKIITEDVGTRRGENYVYSWDVIQNSLHDYAEPIENGAKRMIEVLPPQEF